MPGSAGQAPKASSERIRGELLKLVISVAKRTIQRYMRGARPPTLPHGQSWKTFLANHTAWACDFLQVYDIWFRPLFAFFVIDIKSREVIHVGVTRTPTEQWTAQQLRNITPFGEGPDVIIRDRDSKFGTEFDRVASSFLGAATSDMCWTSTAFSTSTRADHTKASINEFRFRSRPRSSVKVSPYDPFRFSRGSIMTTKWQRESADLRSSQDRQSRWSGTSAVIIRPDEHANCDLRVAQAYPSRSAPARHESMPIFRSNPNE